MLKKLLTITPPRISYPIIHKVLGWLDQFGRVPAGVTTYLGHSFVYPLDSVIGREIALGEEWDALLGTIIPALLPMDEPVMCEVGSNIGASLLQLMKVKPHAQLLAFEPSDRFRPFLERNLERAAISHVEVSSLLVGKCQGTMWLYNTSSSASAARARYDLKPRRKQLVTMTTLDEVFRQRPRVDFIKVDTDGFDFEVLRGAEETLARDSPVLYFELFPTLLSAPAADLMWLQSTGYRHFVCFTSPGKLLGVTDNVEQTLAWAGAELYCNILVCREGSPAQRRIEGLVSHLTLLAI